MHEYYDSFYIGLRNPSSLLLAASNLDEKRQYSLPIAPGWILYLVWHKKRFPCRHFNTRMHDLYWGQSMINGQQWRMVCEVLPKDGFEIAKILTEKCIPITIISRMREWLCGGVSSFTVNRIEKSFNGLCCFWYQGIIWITASNKTPDLDLGNENTQIEYCFSSRGPCFIQRVALF